MHESKIHFESSTNRSAVAVVAAAAVAVVEAVADDTVPCAGRAGEPAARGGFEARPAETSVGIANDAVDGERVVETMLDVEGVSAEEIRRGEGGLRDNSPLLHPAPEAAESWHSQSGVRQ